MDNLNLTQRIFKGRNTVFTVVSIAVIVTTVSILMAIPSPVFATQMVQVTPENKEETPLKWEKPKPGHIIDGAKQMIIAGTDIKLYLTGGSAQIDLREGQGRTFIPAGARYKEKRGTGGYGSTQKVPATNGGSWYDNSVRRLIFLAGRSVGTEEYPLTLTDEGWLVVRGYNAAVSYKINENSDDTEYRFPLRDPEAEAREAASQKRLRSADPTVRAKEQYERSGGLRSAKYYRGGMFSGVFNGF